jgi:hypothetical protein
MMVKSALGKVANSLIQPFGIQIQHVETEKLWDILRRTARHGNRSCDQPFLLPLLTYA